MDDHDPFRWRRLARRRTDPNQLTLDWGDPLPRNRSPEDSSPPAPQTDRVRRRVVARLPVPKPLPGSVAAGRFGYDENGRPIRPQPDEVRAITEQHAEKIIELLEALDKVRDGPSRECLIREIESLIAAYAEDFGSDAADQLEAYVRRELWLSNASRSEQFRTR